MDVVNRYAPAVSMAATGTALSSAKSSGVLSSSIVGTVAPTVQSLALHFVNCFLCLALFEHLRGMTLVGSAWIQGTQINDGLS